MHKILKYYLIAARLGDAFRAKFRIFQEWISLFGLDLTSSDYVLNQVLPILSFSLVHSYTSVLAEVHFLGSTMRFVAQFARFGQSVVFFELFFCFCFFHESPHGTSPLAVTWNQASQATNTTIAAWSSNQIIKCLVCARVNECPLPDSPFPETDLGLVTSMLL